jgi:hypothetical protein
LKDLRLEIDGPGGMRVLACGVGPDAYLWFGTLGHGGAARNTAATRRFLRRALERLEQQDATPEICVSRGRK